MKIENQIFDFHGKFLIRCSAFVMPNPDKTGLATLLSYLITRCSELAIPNSVNQGL